MFHDLLLHFGTPSDYLGSDVCWTSDLQFHHPLSSCFCRGLQHGASVNISGYKETDTTQADALKALHSTRQMLENRTNISRKLGGRWVILLLFDWWWLVLCYASMGAICSFMSDTCLPCDWQSFPPLRGRDEGPAAGCWLEFWLETRSETAARSRGKLDGWSSTIS